MKKVLILGSGSIALKHIKNLLELNYYVLVYTKNKSFDIKNTNIEKLHYINNIPKIHFAIIANKTSDHLKYIKIIIKKKIHIYCEKPIFFKKFDFLDIKKKIKMNNLIFHCGYQLLQDTKVIYLKNKLKNLKIKSFTAEVGHNFEKWRNYKNIKDKYFSNTKKGGGTIFELVHEINLVQELFGRISNIKSFKLMSKKYKCEDVVTSIIYTSKNIIGTLYQDMYSKSLFRKLRVITSQTTFVIDFAKNQIFKNDKILKIKGKNTQQILLRRNLIEFITKIKLKDKSTINYDIAVNDLKTCIKMHEKK
jgi:predicted dehydrogenase